MTAAWRAAAVLAALCVPCCSPGSPSSSDPPGAPTAVALTPVARAIVDLTNTERTRAGLTSLEPEARLVRAAQIQAEQMARAGRLDHDLPGQMYPTLDDRMKAVEYSWQAVGENLASGQAGAEAVMADWMRSPAHRQNILNPAFTQIGVHHVNDPAGRRYFAQVFARPR